MIEIEPQGYFISGSDTDVGKTWVGSQVVSQLRQLGLTVETRKPAESGCREDANGELLTHDAAALQRANGNRESIDRINPHRFRAALAPHRAARLEGRKLMLEDLLDACERDAADSCLIVEGAGGFYSPLAENGLNADLASALQLPVIIVVADRIGAVNQALMTLEAVASRQLRTAAVVLNQVQAQEDPDMNNAEDLAALSEVPIFCCDCDGRLPILFSSGHAHSS